MATRGRVDVVLLAGKYYDVSEIQTAAEFFESESLRAFSYQHQAQRRVTSEFKYFRKCLYEVSVSFFVREATDAE